MSQVKKQYVVKAADKHAIVYETISGEFFVSFQICDLLVSITDEEAYNLINDNSKDNIRDKAKRDKGIP